MTSANKTILQLENILNMSLKYNKNKIGRKLDPWGTTVVKGADKELLFLIEHSENE